ncbi:MAG: glycerol kinase GlpK [Fibrobacteria bacterium]|nr:glycerol kinase GlpK [Fibrobacteria bacterium]
MLILAIDQGTTGTTTILYDKNGKPFKKAYREFTQIYPKPGWVEHDPMEIWQTTMDTVEEVCNGATDPIGAVGITNQRETVVIWDKTTGKPVYNAIVWQCRRTADICNSLSSHSELIRQKTGLPVDAYFSGTKAKWILEQVEGLKTENLLFGTIDTWLIWKLTGGRTHATDYTNASRTMLFNIIDKTWDDELCTLLGVPRFILPEVRNSMDDYGVVETIPVIKGVPVLGVVGDQQGALFGQACFNPGEVKNTYGTGCFLMMNTGSEAVLSNKGLITTLAADGEGKPCYALEGSIFIAGAAIQWLRDELKILNNASDSEEAALSVDDNNGVYLVPAFAGLGAPYWNMEARGILTGLTRGANRNHVIRAALEAMAYQTWDVLSVMEEESGTEINQLAVDGGAVANNFLMQFQADIIGRPVLRPEVIESTSLGSAYLAGLKTGLWKTSEELSHHKSYEKVFRPEMAKKSREQLLKGWKNAVNQVIL